MHSRLLSLRPPRLVATAELRWVLLRAFGPPDAESVREIEGGRASRLAVRLGVAPRLGARRGLQRLADELGRRAALDLVGASARVVEREARLQALVELLRRVFDFPFALLKFAALRETGLVLEGSRYAGDLDVLVPRDRLDEAASALAREGFRTPELRDAPASHQLAPMVGADGIGVEIHRWLPGVRVAGDRAFADLGRLLSQGALLPLAERETCLVPSRDMLAAHLLVHGFVQHGFAPRSYGPMRTLGDLIDLGIAEADPDALERVRVWIADELKAGEMAAVAGLCRQLAAGDAALFTEATDGRPERTLLDHFVAGLVDDEYERSLRFSHLRAELRFAPGLVAKLRVLRDQRVAAPRALSFVGLLLRRSARRVARARATLEV